MRKPEPTRFRASALFAEGALRELNRLGAEAAQRYEEGCLAGAVSALAAVPSVLHPLVDLLHLLGLAEALARDQRVGNEEAGGNGGYL